MNRRLKPLIKKLRTDRAKGTFQYWTDRYMTPPWVKGFLTIKGDDISDKSLNKLKAIVKESIGNGHKFQTPIFNIKKKPRRVYRVRYSKVRKINEC